MMARLLLVGDDGELLGATDPMPLEQAQEQLMGDEDDPSTSGPA